MSLQKRDHDGEGNSLVAIDKGVSLGDTHSIERAKPFDADVVTIRDQICRTGQRALQQSDIPNARQTAKPFDKPGVPVHRKMN